jgi:hypothetical protein
MLENHPRILEFGFGRGYFLQNYLDHGGDIVGFDTCDYYQPQDFFVRDLSRVVVSSVLPDPRVIDGRSLYFSWPQPNSPFPIFVLRWFRENGGKYFIFQPGGYGTDITRVGANTGRTTDGALNYPDLIDELDGFWREVENPPEFLPLHSTQNIFVFKLRN